MQKELARSTQQVSFLYMYYIYITVKSRNTQRNLQREDVNILFFTKDLRAKGEVVISTCIYFFRRGKGINVLNWA